jgi:tetraacyldisaccharide 4'-kinase
VDVLATPNRGAALREYLPAHAEARCVLLDDGFQHRQVHRDLDLVLVDARAQTITQHMLPAGHLREPLANLKRADAVIVTRADADISKSEVCNLSSQIELHHGRLPVAWSRHHWIELAIITNDGRTRVQDSSWLHNKRVVTMLVIGRPSSVMDELGRLGAKIMANVPAADHERYDRAKVTTARGLCEGCDALVVTAKDWVKLRSLIDLQHWPTAIIVPRLEIDVFDGESALKELILAAVQAPESQV